MSLQPEDLIDNAIYVLEYAATKLEDRSERCIKENNLLRLNQTRVQIGRINMALKLLRDDSS